MAAEFDRLEQVIEFVVKLDEKSRQDLIKKMDDLNAQRAESASKTDDKIVDAQKDASDKKVKDLEDELKEKEKLETNASVRSVVQIDKLIKAHDEVYREVLKLQSDFHKKGEKLSDEHHAREISQLNAYNATKEKFLEERDEAKSREKTSPRSLAMGTAKALGKQTGSHPLLGHMAETATGIAKAVALGKVEVDLLEKLVDIGAHSLDAARAQTSAAFDVARGPALANLASPAMFEQFQDIVDDMTKQLNIRPEEEGDVRSAIKILTEQLPLLTNTGQGFGVNQSGHVSISTEDNGMETPVQALSGIKPMFNQIKEASDSLGMSFAQTASLVTKLARLETDQSNAIQNTVFHLQSVQSGFRQLSEDLHVNLDIPKLVEEASKATAALAPFHLSLETVAGMMNDFAVEINNSVISMSDFVQWVTGSTQTDMARGAFMVQNLEQSNDKNFKELQDALKQSGATGVLQKTELVKDIAEGAGLEFLARLGLKNITEEQRQTLQLEANQAKVKFDLNFMVDQIAGGGSELEKAMVRRLAVKDTGLPALTGESMDKFSRMVPGMQLPSQDSRLKRESAFASTASHVEDIRNHTVGISTAVTRLADTFSQEIGSTFRPISDGIKAVIPNSSTLRSGGMAAPTTPGVSINFNPTFQSGMSEESRNELVKAFHDSVDMDNLKRKVGQITGKSDHQKMIERMKSEIHQNSTSVGYSIGTSESR